MDGIFFGLGVLAAVVGFFIGGTEGISFIGIACFLGISARLVQALKQHKHLIEVLTQNKLKKRPARILAELLRHCIPGKIIVSGRRDLARA